MIRIAAVASFLSLLGCAAGSPAVRPPPAQTGAARTGEWQQLPQESVGRSGLALQNVRTKAVVTVTFVAAGRTPQDAAGEAALSLAAGGANVDRPESSVDGRRAGFAWSGTNDGHDVRGRVAAKSLDSPLVPLALIIGVWPSQHDAEMARDFETIVEGVSVR